MSLSARQRHALDRIERTLVLEEPRLGSLFAVFTRLTQHEALPVIEQVTSRLRRRAAMIGVMLIGIAIMVAASLLIPGGRACPMASGAAGRSLSASLTAAASPAWHQARPEISPPIGCAT